MDEWDDELSEPPADRRRIALRRGAYLTVCAGLVTMIVVTLLFVGSDTKSVATVGTGASVASSDPETTGFAASLPAGATATSLSDPTSSTDTNTSGPGTTAAPATTGSTGTTSTTPTTVPGFFFAQPHQAVGGFKAQPPTPGCPPPPAMPSQDFTFSTPQPGTLAIKDALGSGSGAIDPSGSFSVFVSASKGTYTGQLPASTGAGTVVSGTFTQSPGTCSGAYDVTWNFVS